MDGESERARLNESGDQDQIDQDLGNFESEAKVSESLDDEEQIEIRRTRKLVDVTPTIDESTKEPVGKKCKTFSIHLFQDKNYLTCDR